MLNSMGEVIYVGKAKNLSKRIASYFSRQKDVKTQQLLANVHNIEITVTGSEEDALLLELQLIKQLQPKYNILFKDAKSFPYICITAENDYPQFTFYRDNKKKAGMHFGPYPSVHAAREGLELLQKIFRLRQCDNNIFKNRNRPCLQYQIQRCSGSCVGLITKRDYMLDVENAKKFLQGKTKQIINELIVKMDNAAEQLLYEQAAYFREQIINLRKMQKQQVIIDHNSNLNIDVLGIAYVHNNACIHWLCIRGGHILGSRQFFPKQVMLIEPNLTAEEIILETFIVQHYSNNNFSKQLPEEIIASTTLSHKTVLENTITKLCGQNISINYYARGDKAEWIKIANNSATAALHTYIAKQNNLQHLFVELTNNINSNKPLKRIECFDISHTQGDATIGVCVVFTPNGAVKKDYRKYNIKTAKKGDDYKALEETLKRHYSKIIALGKQPPDLVLIDGGKGQLTIAERVLKTEFNLLDTQLLGIAKGKTRKIGQETLYLSFGGNKLKLTAMNKSLQLIQQIRDEAHYFAITGHRTQKAKKMFASTLEKIIGVGFKRHKELLKQFGGFKEVCKATTKELAKVPGISKILAQRIYDALHENISD